MPDVTVNNVEEFETAFNRALWPFPPVQLEWLARQAPRLQAHDPDLAKRLLDKHRINVTSTSGECVVY